MPPNLKLNAVAFISPQNYPILVKTFSKQEDNGIKYQYIAHTSLDVIEERGERYGWTSAPRAEATNTVAAAGKSCENYLGLLYAMEDVAVYGYITALKMKIVIAIPFSDAVVRDAEVIVVSSVSYSHALFLPCSFYLIRYSKPCIWPIIMRSPTLSSSWKAERILPTSSSFPICRLAAQSGRNSTDCLMKLVAVSEAPPFPKIQLLECPDCETLDVIEHICRHQRVR